MTTSSAYLDQVHRELWERDSFSSIPDRDLPRADTTIEPGEGPAVMFAGFPTDYSLAFLLALLKLDVRDRIQAVIFAYEADALPHAET